MFIHSKFAVNNCFFHRTAFETHHRLNVRNFICGEIYLGIAEKKTNFVST